VAAAPALAASPAASPVAEAERLAAEAVRRAQASPAEGLELARKALLPTRDFEPTAFVKAGRKGEVVEDEYLAARAEYRRHRARLYQAVGECLARMQRPLEASRYLRRAVELDSRGGAAVAFARALVALGRGREALEVLLPRVGSALEAEALAVAQAAADAARIPSLQVEIDRVRLQALKLEPPVEPRDGPLVPPERTRLSTGGPFRLDAEGVTLLYLAEPSCRSCSADLEALKRTTPAGTRVLLAPVAPDQDRALRQALALYRYDWPVVVGPGLVESLKLQAPSALVVARRGWIGAVARPPFAATVPQVVGVLGRSDVQEAVPRAEWNRRPVERARDRVQQPALLPEGLAPGEDDPAPEAFSAAVSAYQAGRHAEALRLFESLEARGDGWLLPPEARLDRALCLAGMGQHESARRLLLSTGDSRFQEAVDRALERVGNPATRKK
jgi:tetratricopeptide (TPR) repeat protein